MEHRKEDATKAGDRRPPAAGARVHFTNAITHAIDDGEVESVNQDGSLNLSVYGPGHLYRVANVHASPGTKIEDGLLWTTYPPDPGCWAWPPAE